MRTGIFYGFTSGHPEESHPDEQTEDAAHPSADCFAQIWGYANTAPFAIKMTKANTPYGPR